MVTLSIEHLVIYALLLLSTLTTGLPFSSQEPERSDIAIALLERRVRELERTKSSLEWSIRAAERFQQLRESFDKLLTSERAHESCNSITCSVGYISMVINKDTHTCGCISIRDIADFLVGTDALETFNRNQGTMVKKRDERVSEPVQKELNFTYIPPPKTDITPQLLEESLAVQPQDTATVASVMPFFRDGVISYGCQLNGFVASTLTLNASIDLPCGTIGTQPQPDLELRPKAIENGTAQKYVPDCSIVAVNMYDPKIITYWVQDRGGAIYSLTGSNKVEKINQLNTAASTSLVLRAKPAANHKRNENKGIGNHVGEAIIDHALEQRAIVPPDWHTASMTPEACAAIKCNNNGGNPAMYNPFTKTCGCREPAYVEVDYSG